jgi:hypothetical protein
MRQRLAIAVSSIAIAALVASCRSPTQVTIEITTDVPCSNLRGTSITVGRLADLESKPPATATQQCDNGRIGALVIVPSGANDDEVAVRVVSAETMDPDGCVSNHYPKGCIVARRALRFIPHSDLNVGILMANACSGLSCPSDQTCIEGTCRSAIIPDPSACEVEQCNEGVLVPGGIAKDAGTDATLRDVAIDTTPPPDTLVDAQGAGCVVWDGGKCSPQVIASNIVGAVDIAIAGSSLYWTYRTGVMRANLDGTGALPITTVETSPFRLATDATSVYWTDPGAGTVRKAPLAGGAPSTVALAQFNPVHVVSDGTWVYWSNQDVGTVSRAHPDGSSLSVIATVGSQVNGIAVDATLAYVCGFAANAILTAPVGGGVASPFEVTSGSPIRIVKSGPSLFWTTYTGNDVFTVPTSGGTPLRLASNQVGADGIAVDATSVYVAARGAGTVSRVPRGGGSVTVLAAGQQDPWGVAVDDTYVYWVSAGSGKILRVAK